MFAGLSAFPLTPLKAGELDLETFGALVLRLSEAGVDSIGALGSTGSYAYLSTSERAAAARVATQAAGNVPVIIGIGAPSTRAVLTHLENAQDAGASGVLLAPVTYQPLTDDEVYGLYERVSAATDIPIILYDNPATTRVQFTDNLYASIAKLSHISSIKLPSMPSLLSNATERLTKLRAKLPRSTSLGISGDAAAVRRLLAGCETWYSVIGGLFPGLCVEITRAARNGDNAHATTLHQQLNEVWQLFARHGSYRVTAALATELGLLREDAVHHPVSPLAGGSRVRLRSAAERLGNTI